MALPLAGALVWAAVGLATLRLAPATANLLWVLHLAAFALDPTYLPLTLGIGLGLHWVVFSWVVGHPVGLIHAAHRTVLVTGLWWLIPTHRISAVAAGVVTAYGLSICLLATRPLNTAPRPIPGPGSARQGGDSAVAVGLETVRTSAAAQEREEMSS